MNKNEIQNCIIKYGWKALPSFKNTNTITYKKACMVMIWNYYTMKFVVSNNIKSIEKNEFSESFIRDPFNLTQKTQENA